MGQFENSAIGSWHSVIKDTDIVEWREAGWDVSAWLAVDEAQGDDV